MSDSKRDNEHDAKNVQAVPTTKSDLNAQKIIN